LSGSLALIGAFPGLQTPAKHMSSSVQGSPSSQGLLSAFGVTSHLPVAELQDAAEWH
jgi:hypothetical protein